MNAADGRNERGMDMRMERFTEYRDKVVRSCAQVIVGKDDVIELVLVCFVCGGHVLLEDLPGTGKTMLLRSFAKTIGGQFARVQFTPDLLPSDLTGLNYFDQKRNEFLFRKGPVFTNVLLADEINRATPRTQSSLLEAMEEKQVTVDGVSMPLPDPFMVMATQNPVESYGTFPLPEAQTDRFFMRLRLGYMTREQELSVLGREDAAERIARLSQAVTAEETAEVRSGYRQVRVGADVAGYLMDIIGRTRSSSDFVTGASTRGAIALYRASQAYAAFRGREFVIPEDVKKMAVPVLAHRLSGPGGAGETGADTFLMRLISEIPVPVERDGGLL